MSERKDFHRTTIYMQKNLYDEMKKQKGDGWLSGFVEKQLEMELYCDKPEYVERRFEEWEQEKENEKKSWLLKIQIANEKASKKRERIEAYKPEVNLYRTITPSKNKPKKDGEK